ncbi:hypothetical protein HCB49_04060 [Listeria sp. FSL L7-0123]|uniref:Uncharacterized protein n=2 Tax=Listeria TaxID=1637 RepID=A0A7X0ZB18_9LIST|nr:hypothetical protein [Listeria cossartiae subsp. cayugensis]
MEQQENQHNQALETSEKRYQEQSLINLRKERIMYQPYLSLSTKEKIDKFTGKMERDKHNVIIIPFKIKNEGLGAAFSVYLNYLEKEEMKGISTKSVSVIAIQPSRKNGYNILGVAMPIHMDILRVEGEADFYLYLNAIDKEGIETKPDDWIRWNFSIEFFDIQERKYIQDYQFFSVLSNDTIVRMNSEKPKFIEFN